MPGGLPSRSAHVGAVSVGITSVLRWPARGAEKLDFSSERDGGGRDALAQGGETCVCRCSRSPVVRSDFGHKQASHLSGRGPPSIMARTIARSTGSRGVATRPPPTRADFDTRRVLALAPHRSGTWSGDVDPEASQRVDGDALGFPHEQRPAGRATWLPLDSQPSYRSLPTRLCSLLT